MTETKMSDLHQHIAAASEAAGRAAFEIGLADEWSTPVPRPALAMTLACALDALGIAAREVEAAQLALDRHTSEGDPK